MLDIRLTLVAFWLCRHICWCPESFHVVANSANDKNLMAVDRVSIKYDVIRIDEPAYEYTLYDLPLFV